jgi:serine/threonine protein kinase
MEVIGSGAFSIIYKGDHKGNPCAVKFSNNKENSRRFLRKEIDILKQIKGSVYGLQLLDYRISRPPRGFIKYEMLDKCLFDFCQDSNVNHLDIKKIAFQLLEGIKDIHHRGIVHCDLKPENIMLDTQGNVKIIDFGNSLHIKDLSTTRQTIGTLHYRPPESLINSPLTIKVDYWAYGCIIVELLTKRPLFSPKRDNNMFLNSALLGMMIMVFGDFNTEFLNTGLKTRRYFDVENNYTFKFKYLLGEKTSLYEILRYYDVDKMSAQYWSDYLYPFFKR